MLKTCKGKIFAVMGGFFLFLNGVAFAQEQDAVRQHVMDQLRVIEEKRTAFALSLDEKAFFDLRRELVVFKDMAAEQKENTPAMARRALWGEIIVGVDEYASSLDPVEKILIRKEEAQNTLSNALQRVLVDLKDLRRIVRDAEPQQISGDPGFGERQKYFFLMLTRVFDEFWEWQVLQVDVYQFSREDIFQAHNAKYAAVSGIVEELLGKTSGPSEKRILQKIRFGIDAYDKAFIKFAGSMESLRLVWQDQAASSARFGQSSYQILNVIFERSSPETGGFRGIWRTAALVAGISTAIFVIMFFVLLRPVRRVSRLLIKQGKNNVPADLVGEDQKISSQNSALSAEILKNSDKADEAVLAEPCGRQQYEEQSWHPLPERFQPLIAVLNEITFLSNLIALSPQIVLALDGEHGSDSRRNAALICESAQVLAGLDKKFQEKLCRGSQKEGEQILKDLYCEVITQSQYLLDVLDDVLKDLSNGSSSCDIAQLIERRRSLKAQNGLLEQEVDRLRNRERSYL